LLLLFGDLTLFLFGVVFLRQARGCRLAVGHLPHHAIRRGPQDGRILPDHRRAGLFGFTMGRPFGLARFLHMLLLRVGELVAQGARAVQGRVFVVQALDALGKRCRALGHTCLDDTAVRGARAAGRI
jgi:hypothetical protein